MKDMVVAPVDAYYYLMDKATNSYSIVPEVYGNNGKEEKTETTFKRSNLKYG